MKEGSCVVDYDDWMTLVTDWKINCWTVQSSKQALAGLIAMNISEATIIVLTTKLVYCNLQFNKNYAQTPDCGPVRSGCLSLRLGYST